MNHFIFPTALHWSQLLFASWLQFINFFKTWALQNVFLSSQFTPKASLRDTKAADYESFEEHKDQLLSETRSRRINFPTLHIPLFLHILKILAHVTKNVFIIPKWACVAFLSLQIINLVWKERVSCIRQYVKVQSQKIGHKLSFVNG